MVTLLFLFTALCSAMGRYILYEDGKTWFEAQSFCRTHHSDLATIVNLDQNSLVTTGTENFAWIGLYDDSTKWIWSNGNIDLNSTGFTNWGTSNPDYNTMYPTETRICVSMDGSGFWDDRDCSHALPRVCYEDPNVYTLINAPLSWSSSYNDCANRYSHITSVRDETEYAAVLDKIGKPSWIGLYRYTWINWSDSTYSTFSNWDEQFNYYFDSSADSHCAMIYRVPGTWFKAPCDTKLPFFCNAVPSSTGTSGSSSGSGGEISTGGRTFKTGYTSRVKLSLRTDANLENPVIKQQILQQIHAKVGEHVNSDIKLRWTQNDGPNLDKKKNTLKCYPQLSSKT